MFLPFTTLTCQPAREPLNCGHSGTAFHGFAATGQRERHGEGWRTNNNPVLFRADAQLVDGAATSEPASGWTMHEAKRA